MTVTSPAARHRQAPIRLFLCGDVMTGRGVDQVLRHPCDPALHESYVGSATGYVALAEAANGPIPRGVEPSYIWGAALDEFERMRPDARIVNLETSITRSEDYAPKGINYRMSPENANVLQAAAIDCCVLANNHVLDFGRDGLLDTLSTLKRLDIKTAGAGRNLGEAAAPAILHMRQGGRALVYSFGCVNSGTPHSWAARNGVPGVNLLGDLSNAGATAVADAIKQTARPGDLIVVSVHWGTNWGYDISNRQRDFAHALIDRAGVAVIYGHSSHHPKAIEVYRDRLILYGCGDFVDDYEGIKGYEQFRDDLVLMYFADVAPGGNLVALEMVPLQIRKFQLARPAAQDIGWMQEVLDRECREFDAGVALEPDGRLMLSWHGAKRPT